MKSFLPILALACCTAFPGCNWGKTPEERYTAEMEQLRADQEKISKQMDELTRKEADRRRTTMARQTPGQKKEKPWWKFWGDDQGTQPTATQEQRPWWQTDAKKQGDNKSTDRPNLLFKPQKSQ